MGTTKGKLTKERQEALDLLHEIQQKMEGTTEEEVLAAVAAARARMRAEREKKAKESKSRRASA